MTVLPAVQTNMTSVTFTCSQSAIVSPTIATGKYAVVVPGEKVRVAVVGAGSWGTALAVIARRAGREVILWPRRPAQAAALATRLRSYGADRIPRSGGVVLAFHPFTRVDIPVGRFGEERDLDGPLLLLVSDAGRFVTGATIVADGGQSVALRG